MTSEESKLLILKQVEAGVLSPEEGSGLLEILDMDGSLPVEPEPIPDIITSVPHRVEVPPIAWYWKLGWSLFLWLGVGLTILSAFWMYKGYQVAGFGVGFILSWIPFILGILLTYAGARLIEAHWVHIKVNSTEEGKPQNIDIAMPLPLGFVGWIFKNFGRYMPEEIRDKHVDEMLVELEKSIKNGEPFQVQVDDEKDGDHVEVLII
jgi:hypothetical protein